MAEEKKKKSPAIRILASVLVLSILAVIGIFVYFLVTGSKYTIPMLFVVIIYPVILYLFVWIKKVFDKNSEE